MFTLSNTEKDVLLWTPHWAEIQHCLADRIHAAGINGCVEKGPGQIVPRANRSSIQPFECRFCRLLFIRRMRRYIRHHSWLLLIHWMKNTDLIFLSGQPWARIEIRIRSEYSIQSVELYNVQMEWKYSLINRLTREIFRVFTPLIWAMGVLSECTWWSWAQGIKENCTLIE